jgi:hypothetical protein
LFCSAPNYNGWLSCKTQKYIISSGWSFSPKHLQTKLYNILMYSMSYSNDNSLFLDMPAEQANDNWNCKLFMLQARKSCAKVQNTNQIASLLRIANKHIGYTIWSFKIKHFGFRFSWFNKTISEHSFHTVKIFHFPAAHVSGT